MAVPFEIFTVPGAQALDKLAELQRSGRGHPVILGEEQALEGFDAVHGFDASQPLDALLAEAGRIDPQAWLRQRAEEQGGWEDVESGKWPAGSPGGPSGLSAHMDTLKKRPYGSVAIVLVPGAEPWTVPCHLRFGGWNECPDPQVHAALFKHWGERYGARVACIAGDVVEFEVDRPPATREAALQLAREQFLYCSDIVYQGTQTLEVMAAERLDAPTWFFWWD